MKNFLVLALILITTEALEWKEFKASYNKSYKNSVEESIRYAIYQSNLKIIAEHNKRFEQGLETYKMGVNKFADMTKEEFSSWLKINKNGPKITKNDYYKRPKQEDLPDEVDWRTKGAVTAVKDQGQCEAWWSFTTTGALEGVHQINQGKLLVLSEQNLIDCTTGKYGNEGCNRGFMSNALEYIRVNGIQSEADYPYEEKDGTCRFNATKIVSVISGYRWVIEDDEEELKSATANIGPIAVGIEATDNMQLYESGIFTDPLCNDKPTNHGGLIVGYGSEGGLDYWIVKNSWGPYWGEKGYVRMRRNYNNMCGIASEAVYLIF